MMCMRYVYVACENLLRMLVLRTSAIAVLKIDMYGDSPFRVCNRCKCGFVCTACSGLCFKRSEGLLATTQSCTAKLYHPVHNFFYSIQVYMKL